ncbi:MAG: cobalamin-dependent protein [Desulfobacterales bacterium]|nr:cobalamin-dependent protein [Desulfobacterales bacterium]
MKVLLISPNTLTMPYPVYPLGLDYVAGAIAEDHQVKIVDLNSLGDHKTLGKVIDNYSPDIIGISLRNIDNTDTINPEGFMGDYRQCIKDIRDSSDVPLVLGGSGFTLFPEEIMEALGADYGVLGEGERLALLLHAIEMNEDTSRIPGIMTRGSKENIPEPWDGSFALKRFTDSFGIEFYLKKGGMLNFQTKRGCPFRCIYCTYPHIEGGKLRFVSPKEAALNALRLQEAGAKYLFVTDSVFNSDYSHSIQVAREFINAGISIPWGAFFAPTVPPEEYFPVLADAGLSHVEFGTEALSDRMLKSYGKSFRVNQILAAHNAAVQSGLHVAHYILLGGPGEDEDSLNETLSNIEDLHKAAFFFFAVCASIRILACMISQWKKVKFQSHRAYWNRFFTSLN